MNSFLLHTRCNFSYPFACICINVLPPGVLALPYPVNFTQPLCSRKLPESPGQITSKQKAQEMLFWIIIANTLLRAPSLLKCHVSCLRIMPSKEENTIARFSAELWTLTQASILRAVPLKLSLAFVSSLNVFSIFLLYLPKIFLHVLLSIYHIRTTGYSKILN